MNSYFQKIEQFEHEILHHSQQLENRLADLTLKETQVQASEICLHFFMSIREGVKNKKIKIFGIFQIEGGWGSPRGQFPIKKNCFKMIYML